MRKRLMPLGMLVVITVCMIAFLHTVEQEKTQEIHTLRVSLWDYDTVSYDRKVIEQFEKEHPDIHIEIISSAPAYYHDSLTAMLDSGERLDVIFVNQLQQLSTLIEKEVALPLDDFVARDQIDLSVYPDIDVLRSPDTGALLGLPYRKDKFVLYFNKDLFDLAQLPYPTEGMTWQDFQQTAAQLTERLKPIDEEYCGAYFLKKEMHLAYFLQSKPLAWDTDDFALLRPGLSLLLQMQEDGSIPPFTRAAMAQDSQRLFEQGNYAMFVHGSWYMNFLKMDEEEGNVAFDWGVVERPVWSDTQPNQNDAWITPVIIHRDSTEVEAAWTFVKYICGEAGARSLAEELILPAYQSEETDRILWDQLQERGIEKHVFTTFSDPVAPMSKQQQAIADAVYTQYGRALLSLDTIEQSMTQMEQARQALLDGE